MFHSLFIVIRLVNIVWHGLTFLSSSKIFLLSNCFLEVLFLVLWLLASQYCSTWAYNFVAFQGLQITWYTKRKPFSHDSFFLHLSVFVGWNRYLLGFLYPISRLISYFVFEKVSWTTCVWYHFSEDDKLFFCLFGIDSFGYIIFQEQKIKEGLYMMGLEDKIFYLSWFITYSVQVIVMCLTFILLF